MASDSQSPVPVRSRILLAFLASAARLVPVPFVDDLLRERVLQIAVRQTIRAHGRTYSSRRLKPLWSEDGGCGGLLLRVATAPFVLLLYPFRKVLRWIRAAKHLSEDLTTMLLLGRALDRRLAGGHLADDTPLLEQEARQLSMAYANASRGMDMKVLSGALGVAITSVGGLPRAAVRTLRSFWKKGGPPHAETIDVPAREQATLDDGTDRVKAALERPDVVATLELFDQRFDENIRILAARREARAAG